MAEAGETSSGSSVRVIERTIDLLKCLSKYPAGVTLTELSQETGLHKATTARFLKTLAQGGFVTPAPTGKGWTLGYAFFEIGSRAIGQTDIRTIAHPIMEAASRETQETVQLAILVDDAVIYIEKIEPEDQPLRINTQIGSRRPIHCTALGKVLAAHLDRADMDKLISEAEMSQMTPSTITEPGQLREELERTRERGFAVDDHEYNELVICAAAPVRDMSGRVVAGLSISTFGIDADSPRFRELTSAAVETANRISAGLGWSGG